MLMLACLAVLPATEIIVPLLSVGSGALDDNSGGGGAVSAGMLAWVPSPEALWVPEASRPGRISS